MVDLTETWGRGYMYAVPLLCCEEWNAFLQSSIQEFQKCKVWYL